MLMRFNDYDGTWARLDDFRRRFDRLFNEFDRSGASGTGLNWPRTNIYDNGESLLLRAELPGLSQEDLNLQIHRNRITLSGERKTDAPKGYSVHRRERAPIKFSRSYSIPVEIDADKVTANLKNGLLTITMPKTPQSMPRQINVNAE